ncbi:restriction endonuclease subunit S [Bradyrhizobium ontarionense]|uniref:Restriction endonuclease subunit S n=1 Tax=Bradyrhizobium ontarionense TaxID=2898149 RepID=A0ABY3R466_9BRAD|nr:restriction endonuclease subunit S [Bradyrhizobium sp. A19]UFZ01862.1 restriction endonuclease subunit S [Bradyrhizobium sp. A19]
MNAERLLAHYEEIAEAPDAIARLRRFILGLAVRGKLVPQNPSHDPASELLEKIAKAINSSVPSADKSEPPLFDLPPSWVWARLGQLVLHSDSGWSPRTENYARSGDEWGVLKVSAVSWGEFRASENKQVLPGTEPRANAVVKKGDFLISRANTAELVARAVIVNEDPVRLMMSDKIVRLRLVNECDHRFVLLVNNYADFSREHYSKHASGVSPSMKNVSRDVILSLPVPLPPLAEQHRIVAKVKDLMALCDRLEAARATRESTRDRLAAASLVRLNAPDPETFQSDVRFALDALPALTARPDQIKQLRQTIFNLAVRGKLVPQDPNDEPAQVLLKRLRANPSDANFHLKDPLARGWEWAAIEDCFTVSGGMQKTPARTPKTNAFPYLGVGNVYRGRLELSNIKRFELLDGELERFRLEPQDILVVEGNGSPSEIGRCAVWNGEIANCVHQNHLIRCRPKEVLLTPYVALYLNSPDGMSEMKKLAITSAGLFSLSVGKIRKIPFPLPPLAEQQRIVAKVNSLMTLCDELEAVLLCAAKVRIDLFDALLRVALSPEADRELEAAE